MNRLTPVVLCGGGGTRLWPRSRPARPKPFLPLVGEGTLFDATLARCAPGELFAPPVIVTGATQASLVEAALPADFAGTVIVEPEPKNTAAAIALAALRLPPDSLMLVSPSDHHIADVGAFRAAALTAADLAADNWLVAFGIEPDRPETGYGYIKRGAAQGGGYAIERFVEKPDLAGAEAFLAEGGYCWNGGIFVFAAGAFLAELARCRPALHAAVAESVADGREEGSRFHPAAAPFASITAESVDYAVMEQAARAAMVPVRMGWSDIGNWLAVRDARPRDGDGNTVSGEAELVACRNVLVDSDGPRVSAIGLEDVIVVVDGNEILVVKASEAQLVGKLGGANCR